MEDAREILRRSATTPDDAIDLGAAALALAALDRPGRTMEGYRDHLAGLAAEVEADAGSASPVLEDRRLSLNRVILDRHGYSGDTQTYDDIQNANLMRVIDRRKGLPVALGILYIRTARAVGWGARGLNFPGHFLVRLEDGPQRTIVDPFNEGRVRHAPDLRDLLKLSAGLDAELDPSHYEAVSNRDILIRLQNNIKMRHVSSGDLSAAERTVESMLLFAPDIAPLWREAGVLRVRLGRLASAVEAFERYAALTDSEAARVEAVTLITRLRQRLN